MIKLFSTVYFIILFASINIAGKNNLNEFLDLLDVFLKDNVVDSRINYAAIQNEPTGLDSMINLIENMDISEFSKDDQKSFWINVYNLLVVKEVVNNYPITSPLDVPGFFKSIEHKAAGEYLTLDEIEHEKLFMLERDPRFHFALVCGAVGCPELISTTYRAEKLFDELENRAESVINNEYFVRIEKSSESIYLSEIFKWYKDDFTQNGLSIVQYLNKYRKDKIPENYSVNYIQYDWSLNDLKSEGKVKIQGEDLSLQDYTPSVLLDNGQYEMKIFNNLYTQTAFFNSSGVKTNQGSRSSYYTAIVSFLYGYSKQINFGFELWIKSVRNDVEDSSPFSLFQFGGGTSSRTALSHFGPRIKLAPFSTGTLKNLSIQSTFYIPVAGNLEETSDEPFLDYDSFVFLNQLFYDTEISRLFSFFGEIDTWIRIDRELKGGSNKLDIPLKLFLSYYPTELITIYGTTEFSIGWQGGTSSYYSQAGIGIKYQLLPGFEIESLLTTFYIGQSAGAGQTYNLGFRLVN